MRKIAPCLLWVGILTVLALPAFAETRTISWAQVTTYSDGTAFEAGRTVRYSVFWATDPGLGSLHTIGASLATTSTTFDPDVQGMTRGGTVYFTTKAFLDTGEESALSPGYAWVVPVVTPPAATLSSIAVSGPTSVNEGGTGTYTATGTWSNGTTTAISPTWSENSTYATISAGGVLTASAVTSNQAVTVTATSGGRTSTMSVTIVDVPGTVPAAAKNLGITGPHVSGTASTWRLTWAPVTTYTNGTPLAPGRTVRYTVYWSDTSTLTAASLRELASGISESALDFNPLSRMTKNRKTYFVVRAILDTGEESPLSTALEWVAANTGPKAPWGGFIRRR